MRANVIEGCGNHGEPPSRHDDDHTRVDRPSPSPDRERGSFYIEMISAVVLAAGASSRMGRQKLLLPIGGAPLVRRVVAAVCGAGFDDVLVVTGFAHEEVMSALEG